MQALYLSAEFGDFFVKEIKNRIYMKNERRKFRIALIFAVLFSTLALISVGCTSGTSPEEAWNKTFGGINWDRAHSVQQTSDGGYILAGYTDSYGAGSRDFWIVKTDSNGKEIWNKSFGGTGYDHAWPPDDGYDHAWSVQQTSDDGYILAGFTNSYGAGGFDCWLVKTDSSGNEMWNKTFGGSDGDDARSVQQTSDGGYIFAGSTLSYSGGSHVCWLVKTDSSGNKEWDKTFGGRYVSDGARSVQQTTDGGYILAGFTNSYGAGYEDCWLIKVKREPTPTLASTIAPTTTASPTPTSTQVLTFMPTQTPMPGFEAIFAIVGFLAMVYLLRSRR